MSINQSHSPSNQPNLAYLTRDRSSSLPQSSSSSRHNPLNPKVPYPHQRKGSLPYNNLPRYPPKEEAMPSDQVPLEIKNKLPSMPLNRKALLGRSSGLGDEYVPLNSPGSPRKNLAFETSDALPPLPVSPPLSSPPYSPRTLTYSRRKYPPIGSRLPRVEPLKIVKRCAGHALLDQTSGSPASPSSSSASIPNIITEVISEFRTASPPNRILSAPLKGFPNNSHGDIGQSSAVSVEAFKPNETTGYVYKPSAVVLTDEYYQYQNDNRVPLKRSTSVAGVRKLSGNFIKILKGGENKK
ncbi:hypothetical protein DFH28DRAFT_1168806 [Melampsora americana]|nr:hypothetical protein DFH28DRAFT_1168806 [Melampsora americana]